MAFGTREILIAVGILVILAILLDGVRRVRASRNGTIRMSKRRQPVFEDSPFDEYGSELPRGGARVVAIRDDDSVEQLGEAIKSSIRNSPKKVTTAFQKRSEQGSADAAVQPSEHEQPDQEPHMPRSTPEAAMQEPVAATPGSAPAGSQVGEEPVAAGQRRRIEPEINPEPVQRSELESQSARPRDDRERSAAQTAQPSARQAAPEVIVLHLMCREEPFHGPELLDALLAQGFRYGSMKIFHRHQSADGNGQILFSAANSVNPGTFDLNAMDDFSTPGITFFMTLDGLEKPLEVFNQLHRSVQAIADRLNGDMKDETRSAMTRQTVEHYRQRILDFTRRSFALSH